MHDPYSIVNLRSCLENVNLPSLLSSFSCPSNPDVEQFLLHNSIEFTKKDQSVTYLVFNHESALVGYYSLAIKPISIQTDHISKTMAKKPANKSQVLLSRFL